MKIMPKHLIIVLTLVALFSMLALMGDNIEYLSIVAERSTVAGSVNSGNVEFETIKRDYENCIYRLHKLEEKSDYGFLLSSIDSMSAGKFVNTLLILAQAFITAIAAFVLGVALNVKFKKEFKRVRKMIRRANARKKHVGKFQTAQKKKVKAHPRGKYAAWHFATPKGQALPVLFG